MTLSGGRDISRCNAWFNNLDKTAQQVTHRTIFVHMKPESVADRYSRVAGVGSAKSWDTLRLTAQPWPKRTLTIVKRLHYDGNTENDAMGPVIMPNLDNPEECWIENWETKKEVYGANIIRVGGTDGYIDDNKLERGDILGEDFEEVNKKAKQRTADMTEPLFFHAMPAEFFEELIHDYSLGAIICIGVGDGAAALACLRHGVPFTGFCLTEEHKTLVRARLEERMSLKQDDGEVLTTTPPRREEPRSDENVSEDSASTLEMGAPETVASPLKKRARQATPSTGPKDVAPVRASDFVKPKAKGKAKVHHPGEDASMDSVMEFEGGRVLFD